jgi:hypothetical protein
MSIRGGTIDERATARTRARYDRNAPFYDLMTRGSETPRATSRRDVEERAQSAGAQ